MSWASGGGRLGNTLVYPPLGARDSNFFKASVNLFTLATFSRLRP